MTAEVINHTIDKLLSPQERRHAWLSRAAEQVRQWKAEDLRNGIRWGEEK